MKKPRNSKRTEFITKIMNKIEWKQFLFFTNLQSISEGCNYDYLCLFVVVGVRISIMFFKGKKKKNYYSNIMQFKQYIDAYLSLFACDAALFASRQRPFTLFTIPQDEALRVIQRVELLIRKENQLLHLESPITLVGDLHGQFLDLLRILQTNGIPPAKKFLFLGDIVDRGEFSFDILFFLFLLKINYPDNIYFIRGNHEFKSLSSTCGFMDEIIQKFSDIVIFNAFQEVFNYMPIAALINEKILCIHGGLGPNFTSIEQINKIPRPLYEFGENEAADEILWSDPSNSIEEYGPSLRGAGCTFGKKVVDEFCKNNNIEMIIRGHECVMNGFEKFFDGKLITLFSASNSTGSVNNDAAVIQFKCNSNEPIIKTYTPLRYTNMSDVFYTTKLRIMPQMPIDSPERSPRKLCKTNKANSNKDLPTHLDGVDPNALATSSVKNLLHLWRPSCQPCRKASPMPTLPALKLGSSMGVPKLKSFTSRSVGPTPIRRPESNRRQRKVAVYT